VGNWTTFCRHIYSVITVLKITGIGPLVLKLSLKVGWYTSHFIFSLYFAQNHTFTAITDSDGICVGHLTVESYTVFICQQSYLLIFGIPSPTHSFFPGLKPSFSVNPSHCSPSFLLLKYLLRGFPGLFTVISEHICFLLLVFSSVFTLLVVGCVR